MGVICGRARLRMLEKGRPITTRSVEIDVEPPNGAVHVCVCPRDLPCRPYPTDDRAVVSKRPLDDVVIVRCRHQTPEHKLLAATLVSVVFPREPAVAHLLARLQAPAKDNSCRRQAVGGIEWNGAEAIADVVVAR